MEFDYDNISLKKLTLAIIFLIAMVVLGYLLLPPPPKTMTQAQLTRALNSTSSNSTSSKASSNTMDKYVLDFDKGMLEGAVMLYLLDMLDNSK